MGAPFRHHVDQVPTLPSDGRSRAFWRREKRRGYAHNADRGLAHTRSTAFIKGMLVHYRTLRDRTCTEGSRF